MTMVRDLTVSPAAPGSNEARPAPLITLRDISKRYANGMLALSGISLTIGDGEFVSLLGPSGCGKSTLLRLIAGLGKVTSGAAEWAKGAHGGGGAERPDLGFVFQEPTLMPWATVLNNVYLPLKLAGVSRRKARPQIEETLRMVGLERFADAYPRQLSGGMKMRTSIARALVTHPRVLLLDEPFAALDEITRFRLNNDLLSLWQGQRWTVVFVTHSVFEVRLPVAAHPADVHPSGTNGIGDHHRRSYLCYVFFRTSSDYSAYCRETSIEMGRVAAGERRADRWTSWKAEEMDEAEPCASSCPLQLASSFWRSGNSRFATLAFRNSCCRCRRASRSCWWTTSASFLVHFAFEHIADHGRSLLRGAGARHAVCGAVHAILASRAAASFPMQSSCR